MSFIQLTPFNNISDVAHSDTFIKEFATITINRNHIVTIRKPTRRSNNSIRCNGYSYTPTIITLVTGDVIKVCESYTYVRGDGFVEGINPYIQGTRTDSWGNTIVEEQG